MAIFAYRLFLIFLAKLTLSMGTVIASVPLKNSLPKITAYTKEVLEVFGDKGKGLIRRKPGYSSSSNS